MWESVWKNNQLEVHMNTADKLFTLEVDLGDSDQNVKLQFNQSELYELLHTLLAINRSFEGGKPYFLD
ncbi:hypothetical protein D3C73_1050460 [compost metagenome]